MKRLVLIATALFSLLGPITAAAHENQPASLDIRQDADGRLELTFRTPLMFGQRHPVRLRLPADWAEIGAPWLERRPSSVVERYRVDPGETGIDGDVIGFPGLEYTVTDVFVRVTLPDGSTTTTIARPTDPGVELRGTGSRGTAVLEYITLGIQHILLGIDHLLFVLGLLLIVRGWGPLVKTITAFTLAHSITLALTTLGYASVPIPPLNAAIALSILFLGPEILRARRGEISFTIRHPWVVAFLFGLLHGFGFASGLIELGLPRAEIPWALLMFNIGVEFGQLAFVLLALAAIRAIRLLEFRVPRWAESTPAYVVGVLGAYWTLDRVLFMTNNFSGVAA